MTNNLFLRNYWLDRKETKERETNIRKIVNRVVKRVKVKRIVKNASN